MLNHCRRARRDAAMIALLLFTAAVDARAAGVQVSVVPDTTVLAGASFQIRLVIPQADDSFNAYETVVLYDPSMITFVSVPLPQQEGNLMTSACASRFHDFAAGPDSLSISHVLLCAGVSVTGPGELYVLNFQAGMTTGTTEISLGAATTFFATGSPVLPLQTMSATVQITPSTAIGPSPSSRFHLLATPNPFNPRTRLQYGVARAAQVRLTIHDPRGQLVMTLVNQHQKEGEYFASWDGNDLHGIAMSAGIYFTRLEAAGEVRTTKLVLVK